MIACKWTHNYLIKCITLLLLLAGSVGNSRLIASDFYLKNDTGSEAVSDDASLSATACLPPLVQSDDIVIYTNGSCVAPMPNFSVLLGVVVTQSIPAGTMMKRGRYFVYISNDLGLIPAGYKVVSVVDNISPTYTGVNNISANVGAGLCSANVNYSGTANDNCGFTAPATISGFTTIGDFNGHRYFRSNATYNWYNANNAAFQLGGYLATISSNAERQFLEGQGYCWIGLNEVDNVGTDVFTWINGESSTYTYWYSGSPMLNQEVSGVIINSGPQNVWMDQSATSLYQFILEMPISSAGQITVTRTAGLASGSAFPVGTTVVTHQVTDESGNTVPYSFNVTVSDNINPTITCAGVLSGYTSATSCTGWINIPNPVLSDNCAVTAFKWQMMGATTGVSSNTGLNYLGNYQFNVGTTTIVYTALDAAGNTASCTTVVTVTDNILPTIVCGAPLTGVTDAGLCTKALSINTPVANDNCSGYSVTNSLTNTSSITNYPFPVGVTTITWKVTDAAGNERTCTQTVAIMDNISPNISYPPNINTNTSLGVCTKSITVPNPTYSDNCTVTSLTWVITGATTGASPTTGINTVGTYTFNKGVTTITYTVKDGNNNTRPCSFTVTVNDNQIPQIITCPANITTTATIGICGKNITVPIPTAIDNCGIQSIIHNSSYGSNTTNASGFYPVGIHTFTWTVTDVNGNYTTCNQTIKVNDIEVPNLICTAVIEVEADLGADSAFVTVPSPVASDNCGSVSLVNDSPYKTSNADASGTYPVGVTAFQWTATDAKGNISTCNVTVIVADNTPPAIVCPETLTRSTDEDLCSAWIEISAPQIEDNEPNITITNSLNGTNYISAEFNSGIHEITWYATDINNNVDSCIQQIIVSDTQPPRVLCQENIIVYTTGNVCGADVFISTPEVIDNCDPYPYVLNTQTDAAVFNDFVNMSDTTVYQWIAIDSSQNSGYCNFTITVLDTLGYIFNCPENINIVLYPGQPYILEDYTLSLPQLDECGAEINYTQSIEVGTEITVSDIVTITAVDGRGNVSSCSFEITLTPYDQPVVSCPEETVTIYFNEDCALYYPDVTELLNETNVIYDGNYTVHQSPEAGVLCNGETPISIWVEDEYGYTTEPCVLQILVADTVAPHIIPVNENNYIATCNPDYNYIPVIEDCNPNATISLVSGNTPIQAGINEMIYEATDGTNTAVYTFVIELVEMPEILWQDIPSVVCVNDEPVVFVVDTEADYYFTVNGTAISGQSFDPSLYEAGVYNIKLNASYAECASMLHQAITVLALPQVNIVGSDFRTCDGEIKLEAQTNATNIQWTSTSDDVVFSSANTANTSAFAVNYGSYEVQLSGTLNGCSNADSVTIYFYEQPEKPFAGEDQVVHLANLVHTEGEYSGVGQTTWSVIEGNADFENPHSLTTNVSGFSLGNNIYVLTASNEICHASDTVTVNVNGLFIPSGFSPNSDGVNDIFEIKGVQNLSKAELRIFNRWGQMVFISERYVNEWGGFNAKNIELPDDTYFYELVLDNGNYNGYVVLKR